MDRFGNLQNNPFVEAFEALRRPLCEANWPNYDSADSSEKELLYF